MTAVAGSTGLGRESLYKAFAPGAKPRYETVIKVLQGLGVRLQVVV
jgi:probable addiction module antidote protein